jgi:imidazolonepropionase
MLRIANLGGVFTGAGFAEKRGRHPVAADYGYVAGPLDLICSPETGQLVGMGPPGTMSDDQFPDVFDAAGLFATAGLIDSHTHAVFAGDRSAEFFQRWSGQGYAAIAASGGGIHRTVADTTAASESDLEAVLFSRLQAMASSGVTAIEVKSGYGGTPEGELRLLRVIHRARQRLAGIGLEVRSTFLGLHALPEGWSEDDYCEAMIGLLPVIVQERLADYADAFPEKGFFSLKAAKQFLGAARGHGLGVRIHADELTAMGSAKAAVALGALSADHLECTDDAGIAALAASETVAILLPSTSLHTGINYVDARRLIDCGVRVALASDFNPGTAPASDLQFTMLLAASKLRMSAAEILCAVTVNAAAALGMSQSSGIISVGQPANVALWRQPSNSNAKSCIDALIVSRLRPVAVVRNGCLFDMSAFVQKPTSECAI